MPNRRVLITGGAGFIGANLCSSLLTTGRFTVAVLDDLSTGHRSNLDDLDVELVTGSVLDPDAVAAASDGADVIVHLAALGSVPRSVDNPLASHEVNATGTVRMLEAARAADASQFILASSSSVYGDSDAPAKHEELPVAPKSPYGASKLAAEGYSLAYQRTYDLPVLALRFFNVFGPLQTAGHAYAAVIPSFIDRAMRGEPLIVHGDGRQSRDFTFVGTVCATILDAIDRGVSYDGPVNLAFGGQMELLEIVDILRIELGSELPLEHIDPRSGDIRHSKADPTRLRQLFPAIDPVDVKTGVSQTVGWFQNLPDYVRTPDRG